MVLAGTAVIGGQSGISVQGNADTPPPIFAVMMMGYLLGYLGVIRLLSMPFLKRFGPSFVAPLVAAIVVYFLGIVVPAIVDVAIQGRVSINYSALHATNWMWTWNEAFSSGGLPLEVAMLILSVGCLVLAVNLVPLFREFRMRRIAVPPRVKQDLADRS